jgi:O-antigen/teichoic acid export membrane protein
MGRSPDDPRKPRVMSREFRRAVGVLSGAALMAHGITAAALPILSRLYSPADFGMLAVFASLASVLTAVAALRLDIAIPIPDQQDEAASLLVLSLCLSAFSASALAVVILLSSGSIAALLGQPALAPYLMLIPVAVFTASAYSSLQSWFVRAKRFPELGRSRVLQSALGTASQVGIGFLGSGPVGLLVGYTVNTGAACVTLGSRAWRDGRGMLSRQFSLDALRRTFVRHSRFPKYSALESVFNNGSVHLPILVLAASTSSAEAGYVIMATTLMQAPMSLLGTAIGQVYLSRAAEEFRAGRLSSLTGETLENLTKLGVGPLLAAGIAAPFAFGPVFGSGWERAGALVAWMTPWFILQFLAVPIGMSLHVTGRQRWALLLQMLGLAIRLGAVTIAAAMAPSHVPEAYALSGAGFYVFYLVTVMVASGVNLGSVRTAVAGAVRPVGIWLVAAVIVAGIASTWSRAA